MEVAPCYTLFTLLTPIAMLNLFTLLTLFTLFVLFKLLYTAYTVACMPIYIDRKVRKQLEWADGFLSKILDK